jgi:single-stranded-DNA-specific exonuclease
LATAKAWHLHPHDPDASRRLAAALGASPVVAQLLLNRGVSDAAAARVFLDSPLGGLHPPGALPGVPEAADRVVAALKAGRKICVYGDYDADGVTGTAVLLRLFRTLGADAEFYVPHRLEEGYGVNADALRQIAENGAKLVITVDCGIASPDEAEVAKAIGLELIVTDHHEMKDRLPPADVLVHPRLPGSTYPFGGLSGAGVALKLAWAVAQRVTGSERVAPHLREYLLDAVGLAALGLVADVVPLRDENRVLVRHGLERLAKKPFTGIQALVAAAGIGANGAIRAEDVAFKLAPRLNAAGRLGCARLVVELLTTPVPSKAKELAEYLEGQNQERQARERKMTQHAREMVEEAGFADAPAIVLGAPASEWHPGVIGIVAGRLKEQFAKPVLIAALKENDEVSTGSGRSVAGFPLHLALAECGDVLDGSGGHEKAAGFKLRPSRLAELRERFCAVAKRLFPNGFPPPALRLDAEVPLSALTFGLLGDIDKLEPYGEDNPRPRFLATGLQVEGTPRRIGQGERHLSFRVRQGGTTIRAVAWGMGDRLDELMAAGGSCCLAFTPKINEWNGQRTVEIEAIDFRVGADPGIDG